ncbi:StAR-related lipid transfer protein 7, mitochondrial [Sparganum proliferum]
MFVVLSRVLKTHIPAQFKFAVNADLRRRRSSLPKLLMLARNVHRICLANLLTLRESTCLLIRRLVDLHRSGYFLSSQERLVTRSHGFLLGACLISFAQDIISEEEMIETAASFEISKFNRDLEKQAKKATPESASVESSQALPASSNAQQSYQPQEFNALEGPITLHIRQTRRAILERCREFFDKLNQRTVIMPVESEVAVVEPPKTPEVKLFDLVGNLSPDGSGFVDSEWELVVEKPHLRLWRRPLGRKPASPLLSDEVEHLSFFEYRACGTFMDISASSFLEVQLNLSYRRQWDPHVSLLETMRPRSGCQDGADQTEIIRWVSKFPFPMAKREYVYARRWWAEMHSSGVAETESKSNAGSFSSGLALIVSRAVTQPSKEVQKHDSSSQPAEKSWYSASVAGPNVVSVSSYESNMLIRSHSRFDEAGLDYFLTYSDDPKLSVSRETVSWLQNMIIPRLLEQLHTAAQRITSSGLPPGIIPVFLHLTAPASPDRGASEDEPSTPPVVRSETDCQQPTEDPSTSETVHTPPSAGFFAEVTQDNSYQLFVS